MIKEFATKFVEVRPAIEARFVGAAPGCYGDILKVALEEMFGTDEFENYGSPDPNRIVAIDHGHYQGTLVFVVGAQGYQPSTYWATSVSYGSCSYCDTFYAINGGDDSSERKAKEYADLAMHMIQRMKLVTSFAMDD